MFYQVQLRPILHKAHDSLLRMHKVNEVLRPTNGDLEFNFSPFDYTKIRKTQYPAHPSRLYLPSISYSPQLSPIRRHTGSDQQKLNNV